MTDPTTCDHIDYDDYFEKCGDCGATGEQIHRAECVPQEDWELTEGGLCSKCGTSLVIEEETKK